LPILAEPCHFLPRLPRHAGRLPAVADDGRFCPALPESCRGGTQSARKRLRKTLPHVRWPTHALHPCGDAKKMAGMKLLLTGDIHIGRASSKVDDPSSHRAADTWLAICDLAIREGVAAVCLSGDVADEANRFWEAIGPLEAGTRRLAESGIATLAVAGNHDHDVLEKLADELPPEQLTLLGRGGRWQRKAIEDNTGHPYIYVDGWSFPQKHVTRDPIEQYDLSRPGDAPVLGMVHGDLDVASSDYGPLSADRLAAAGPDGWLIGHIHTPRLLEPGGAWILQPGSPQALDPGEPDLHGPWLVEVTETTLAQPEMVPLSSVCYQRVDVDLTGTGDLDAARSEILAAINQNANGIAERAAPALRELLLRLTVTGRTPAAAALQEDPAALSGIRDLQLTREQAQVRVERVDLAVLPEIDLDEYARQQSAAGAVARVLAELRDDRPSPETQKLLAATADAIRTESASADYAAIGPPEVSDRLAREHLARQGRALLTELLRQGDA
jgi:DNA repair exonuclease SbcCD nuclease subunit